MSAVILVCKSVLKISKSHIRYPEIEFKCDFKIISYFSIFEKFIISDKEDSSSIFILKAL